MLSGFPSAGKTFGGYVLLLYICDRLFYLWRLWNLIGLEDDEQQ
jgi:hypothetical protein